MELRQVKPWGGGGGTAQRGSQLTAAGGGGACRVVTWSVTHCDTTTVALLANHTERSSHDSTLPEPRTSNLGTEQYRGRLRKLTQDDVSPALWSDDWGSGEAPGSASQHRQLPGWRWKLDGYVSMAKWSEGWDGRGWRGMGGGGD